MNRLGRPLLLLAILLVVDFALPRLLPGDPLAAPAAGGGQDSPIALTPEARARLLSYYGLDRPLPAQFGRLLLATARGDPGYSIAFNQPVGALIARRIGWTLFLAGSALALAAVVGAFLGLLVAWPGDGRAGAAARATGLALLLPGILPEFVTGLVLVVASTARGPRWRSASPRPPSRPRSPGAWGCWRGRGNAPTWSSRPGSISPWRSRSCRWRSSSSPTSGAAPGHRADPRPALLARFRAGDPGAGARRTAARPCGGVAVTRRGVDADPRASRPVGHHADRHRQVRADRPIRYPGRGEPGLPRPRRSRDRELGGTARRAVGYGLIFATDAWRWWLLPPLVGIATAIAAFALIGRAIDDAPDVG